MKRICRRGIKRATALVLSVALLTSVFSVLTSVQVVAEENGEDYTSYVDPFVGTAVDNGQLFPGSVVPYGLVKLSPDTYPHSTNDHAGYDYNKSQIAGFSHTRVEGVGGQGAGGDVLITPTYVNFTSKPSYATRAMTFSHEDEEASPGYYSVEMRPKNAEGKTDPNMGKIKAELTSDTRTGYHRYTFPQAGQMGLTVDLNYTYHGTDIRNAILNVEQGNNTTILSGRFSGRNVSGHGKYTMYFYMETSQPMSVVKTWNGDTLTDSMSQTGNDIGAVLYMDGEAGEVLEVKVSISPISVEQAKRDMYVESPEWDFEAMRQAAKDEWNSVLSKVKVENSAASDPDGTLKKLFYTHLYHMFTTPVNATSTDNTFRATDGNVYEANNYTHYDSWTLWDDFRKYPIIGLVYPEVYKDIIHSIADMMEYGIGTWGMDTQPVPTVRTEHAVALLADGIAKGYTDIPNLEEAYEKAKEIAGTQSSSLNRVDTSVEYSYDDWCIALLAKELGLTDEYNEYLERSFNYKNLYRDDAVTLSDGSTVGLLWPKNNDGSWMGADPEQYGNNGLYQGTLWQYTFWDSNDVTGLVELMGGKENFLKAVSRLYGQNADGTNLPETNPPGRNMLHTNTNEIDLHTPYLFNFAGKPSRTQYWVRQIYTKETWNRYSGTGEYNPPRYEKAYRLSPDGFMETMDDDAGTMAAMFVSAAMGIFPMTPGDTSFQIGTPFFEKITLDVGNGKTFVIKANNVSADNFYIQDATLNGKDFDRTWVDYSEIVRGGVLEFNMGSEPSTWAEDGDPAPSSSDTVDTSIYDEDNALSYSTSVFEESAANDGTIGNTIEITLKAGNTFTGNNGDTLGTDKIEISNVPAGLTAAAVKVSDQVIRITLSGTAEASSLEDSIGDMKVELKDAAFTGAVDSSYQVREDVKVRFMDNQIEYSLDKVEESEADDGSLADTVTLTLTGGATFTGENGDDFVADGKVVLYNLPEGLTASIVRESDTTATLRFTGNAAEHRYSTGDLGIAFEDSAFAGGVTAAQVTNSSRGGMNALVLNFRQDITAQLEEAVAEAEAIDGNKYVAATYQELQTAMETANALLASESPDQADMEDALAALNNALADLVRRTDGFDRLEGEASDEWSGGDLKNEAINLGGVHDGAWVIYTDRYFGNKGIDSVTVSYDNNSSRCASDARVELRLGNSEGRLLATVDLPATGSGWGTYQTVTLKLDDSAAFSGEQDICVVFKGTTDNDHPYICNLDYVQFSSKGNYGRFEAESYDAWSERENGLKTEHNAPNNLDNVGNTFDGAWLAYYDRDFTGEGLYTINVHYANNSLRCASDAKLEIRNGSPDGELIATVDIPVTGTSWDTYGMATVDLSADPYVGSGDIYVVMKGTTDGGHPYVCNLDYVEFVTKEAADKAELQAAITAAQAAMDVVDSRDYTEESWQNLVDKLAAANTVNDDPDATTAQVNTAANELVEAVNNLVKLLTASTITVDPVADQTYTGFAITPKPVVKDAGDTLEEGVDYTLSYSDNVEEGTATIIITGMGGYSGTITATFTITEQPVTSDDETSSDEQTSSDNEGVSSDDKASSDNEPGQPDGGDADDNTPSNTQPGGNDNNTGTGNNGAGGDTNTGGNGSVGNNYTEIPVTGNRIPAAAMLVGVLSLGVFGLAFAVKRKQQ